MYWLEAPVHDGDDCVLCALLRQADSRGRWSDDSVVGHAGPQPDSCASGAFVWPVGEAALGRGRAVMLCAAVITVVWAMVAVAQN
ncbi:hypothetical protein [Streptomyces sp. ISL-99]|uniref:hypothetical protein n=1 Tax=Streptomyces sp. ISL-99 TaxID=2819193 RepID=UPI001BE7B7C6|nr:hypothetical protein [Streptomyces sp. ISL-99]